MVGDAEGVGGHLDHLLVQPLPHLSPAKGQQHRVLPPVLGIKLHHPRLEVLVARWQVTLAPALLDCVVE